MLAMYNRTTNEKKLESEKLLQFANISKGRTEKLVDDLIRGGIGITPDKALEPALKLAALKEEDFYRKLANKSDVLLAYAMSMGLPEMEAVRTALFSTLENRSADMDTQFEAWDNQTALDVRRMDLSRRANRLAP